MSEVEEVFAAIRAEVDRRINELRVIADSVGNTEKEWLLKRERKSAQKFFLDKGPVRLVRPSFPPLQSLTASASHTEKMVDPYKIPTPSWRRWDSSSVREDVEATVFKLETERNEALRQRDEAWERIKELDSCRRECAAKSRLKNEVPSLRNKLRSAEDSSRDFRIARDDAWERVQEMRLIATELFRIAESSRKLECWGCGDGLKGIHSPTCEAIKERTALAELKEHLDNA